MRTVIGQIVPSGTTNAQTIYLVNPKDARRFVNGLIVRLTWTLEPYQHCREGRARVIGRDLKNGSVAFQRTLSSSIPAACPGDYFVLDADEPRGPW